MNLVFRLVFFVGMASVSLSSHAHEFPSHLDCEIALLQKSLIENPMNREEERLLVNPRNGLLRSMLSAWTELSGVNVSRIDGLRLSAEIIAAKLLTAEGQEAFLKHLDQIQPLQTDLQRLGQVYLNPGQHRFVLQRFVQIWKTLVFAMDPVLAQWPLNPESINLTIEKIPMRVKWLQLVKEKTAEAAVQAKPEAPFRMKVTNFTAVKAVEDFFPRGSQALTMEKPLGLVSRYSQPGWAVFAADYALKVQPEELLSLVETATGLQPSASIREKLQDIQSHARKVKSTALHYTVGSRLMKVMAQNQDLVLAESNGHEILIFPLFQGTPDPEPELNAQANLDLQPAFDLEPESLDSWTEIPPQTESPETPAAPIEVQTEPQVEVAWSEPVPYSIEEEIPENLADVHFSPELRVQRYVRDPEALEEFLRVFYTYAMPTPDGFGLELLYFRDPHEGVIRVEFHQKWSAYNRNHRLDVMALSALREEEQKAFWRDLARYHNYEEQKFTYPNGRRVYIGKRPTTEVYISGAVYLKMLVKHGLNDDIIESVLDRVRTATRTNYGDFHARVNYNGHTYQIFFVIDRDKVILKTIF